MNKQLFLYTIITFALMLAVAKPRKLIYVQQIFRHGARYPINIKDNDLSDFAKSQNGQLTSEGKHMQYILGKAMYDKYWKQLFAGTQYANRYDRSQIYVKSTNINRTIESAQSQLQGLLEAIPYLQLPISQLNFSFPPFANSIKYQEDLTNQTVFPVFGSINRNFHPVPIHTEKEAAVPLDQKYKYRANPYDEGDFLVKFDTSNCPNQKFWGKQNMASEDAMKIKNSQKVKNFLAELSGAVSEQVKFQQSYIYIDNYQCQLFLGKPFLSLFNNPDNVKTANFISLSSAVLSFFYTQDQIKTSNTRLLQNTIFRMKEAQARRGPRLVLFSAHDTTLISVLTAFNMMNIPCIMDHFFSGVSNSDTCISDYPQFATNIILQLWQQDNLSHTVKILYNGVQRQIPMCGYRYSCSFAQFEQWANNFYIENPNETCGIREEYTKLYIVIGVLSLFILIFVIIQMSKKFKEKIQKKMQEMEEKRGYIQNFEEKQGGNVQLRQK